MKHQQEKQTDIVGPISNQVSAAVDTPFNKHHVA